MFGFASATKMEENIEREAADGLGEEIGHILVNYSRFARFYGEVLENTSAPGSTESLGFRRISELAGNVWKQDGHAAAESTSNSTSTSILKRS